MYTIYQITKINKNYVITSDVFINVRGALEAQILVSCSITFELDYSWNNF